MLNQRKVTVSCLFVYAGFILGIGLLALAQFLKADDISRWGIAVLCITCTYSIHRSMGVREERLRQAFEQGREHERSQDLAAVR